MYSCAKNINVMGDRYIRNRIYIDDKKQVIIKNIPILLGGCGIGSIIAECALRLGFENITIIDGDQIELSNLNRQNYTTKDVKLNKALTLKNRLLEINPEAIINAHNFFITKDNISPLVKGHKIAINALDFSSDVPLVFDEICQENNIPVLHPYNLGWGGLVTVITADSLSLNSIKKDDNFNELDVVEYVTSYMKFWMKPQNWLEKIIEEYKNEQEILPPPQLSIASWLLASMCTHLLFKIAIGKKTKVFPEFYLSSINN